MRSVRSFPLHKFRIIKRRFVQELDDHSVVALKSLKKHKRVCLYLLENPRKKESVGGWQNVPDPRVSGLTRP